ncbi:C39 family peptidase [Enterococcus sp. UD-01]|uniref:C39 family peptidase n=1 Tax=Enterococcus sp. UD-01 TaxID=3373911 RepID=UPI003833B7EA
MKKKFGYLAVVCAIVFLVAPTLAIAEEKVQGTKEATSDTAILQESTTVESIASTTESSETKEETQSTTEVVETTEATQEAPTNMPAITYAIFNSQQGWQPEHKNGEVSEFSNEGIEALKISINGTEQTEGIQYRTHVSKVGWQNFVQANEQSGVVGQTIEAVEMQLTGNLKNTHDLYYRVKAKGFGWLDWGKNGQTAGTLGFTYFIEGIQIQLVAKSDKAPGETKRPVVQYKKPTINYQSHIKNIGWQASKSNGQMSGTTGEDKRIEALKFQITNAPVAGGIEYRSHVQNIGWQNYVANNAVSGTVGQKKQAEAVTLRLTGELAQHFDIYYRVHAKNFGWLDWAKNGQNAGTAGFSYQIEAIEAQLVQKDSVFKGATEKYFVQFKQPNIVYQSHVQDIGWQAAKKDGKTSGTVGKGKRVEALKIKIENAPVSGGISYRSHVQNIGWQNKVSNNQVSGTVGQSKRIEAFDIKLTGELAKHFDVYYRAHTEFFGWLGWGKNGSISGTSAYSFRLEGVEMLIVRKGKQAPALSASYKKAPADIKNYYLTAPKRVEVKTKHYYTNRALSKGNTIAAGTVINVKRRVIDKNGYPLLETPYGYITANKKIVASTAKGQRTYMDVPYYNQMSYGYPNGCEEFSLYMALSYLGATKNQTIHQVTNAVPKVASWGNPNDGFNGDPKQSGGFHTIYPKAFTPYAKRYAPNSKDISGVGTDKFKEELLKGNPIVVWGTYPYLAPPKVYSTYYGSWKVENLHVWLITGFDGNTFYVADPIYGKLQASENTVALSYSPNKMAVTIDK